MGKMKVVALLACLLMISMVMTGCFEEEESKKSIEISLLHKNHKIYSGDSTTYVLLITSNHNVNDTITVSVAKEPSGWEVSLSETEFNLTSQASMGIFVMVNSSADASKGDYKVKIEAYSEVKDKTYAKTVTTRVIEESGTRVRIGDKVSVDYLGYLNHFGRHEVFDTSIEDVAEEDGVPKTSDFGSRGAYDPLKVYVGPEDPDPSDPYSGTVDGFWEGIENMRVGQSRTVVVPPKKGYGKFQNITFNLTDEITIVEIFTYVEWDETYDEDPYEGMILEHHFWDWNITIEYMNMTEDKIQIIHNPFLNEITQPYGWDSEVIYKNRSDNEGLGKILIKHHVEVGTPGVYGNYKGKVTEVEGDEFIMEYNSATHNLGQDILFFDITLVDILD